MYEATKLSVLSKCFHFTSAINCTVLIFVLSFYFGLELLGLGWFCCLVGLSRFFLMHVHSKSVVTSL